LTDPDTLLPATDPALLAPLFQPFTLAPGLELPNRIVLAPCTRNRASADMGPSAGAAAHYASRAGAGLLVTEAVLISAGIQGYLDTPGIYTDAHEAGWAGVARAVHAAGGRIFLQLWHPGRMAHSHFAGRAPLAPSAVLDPALRRQVGKATLYHEEPEAMTEAQIEGALADYEAAARRALRAGFDGVEIHGANGYLPEQFWRGHTNRRTDLWGGTVERRARFAVEVCRRLAALEGGHRVALRLSPAAYFSEMRHAPGDNAALALILAQIAPLGLAYVHTGVVSDDPVDYLGDTSTGWLRAHWPGVLVGNGGYTPAHAAGLVAAGGCELAAFGKLFLANPDLPDRLRAGVPLRPYGRWVLDAFA
jgi:2,4-dienoyl-CoA reductase-like NADH-dependent reductase (Old Yellow Enzyme family)